MFENILGYQLFGNNVMQYALFLGVILLSIIVAKIAFWLFSKTFLVFTKKTKTQLDDLLIQSLQGPIILAILLGGLQVGTRFLVLTDAGRVTYNKILGVGIIITIAWFIMRIVNAILKNYIAPLTKKSKSKFDDTLFPVIKSFVNFTIIALALIIILQNLGIQVTGLVAGLGIGGLAFALAAQDLLSNMFGGAAIVTDKPFQVGDRLKVDGQDGTVKKITLRSTTLKTFGGTTVVMPNKRIADSTLENISSEKMRRVLLILGLTYNTSSKKLEQAKTIIKKIIAEHDTVDNTVSVTFNNFGPYSLDIQVIYWIKDLNNILAIKDDINMAIKTEFDKAKLDFAFPTQTIHIEK